jgi:hypothetical protein
MHARGCCARRISWYRQLVQFFVWTLGTFVAIMLFLMIRSGVHAAAHFYSRSSSKNIADWSSSCKACIWSLYIINQLRQTTSLAAAADAVYCRSGVPCARSVLQASSMIDTIDLKWRRSSSSFMHKMTEKLQQNILHFLKVRLRHESLCDEDLWSAKH